MLEWLARSASIFRVTQLNCLRFRAQRFFVTWWLGFRANRDRCMLGLQSLEVRGKRVRAVREVREVGG